MKKTKQMIIISIIIIIITIVFLCVGGKPSNKQVLDIPKKESISFVEIYEDFESSESKNNIIEDNEKIAELYKALSPDKKRKKTESFYDLPINVKGELIKIVLKDDDDCNISMFLYQDDSEKYYIEIPYIGIYEISEDEYKAIISTL